MSVYKKDIDSYQNILDKIRNGFDTLVFNSVEEQDNYDFERASDMRDYCEHWESTYNPDDGSM